MAKAESKDYCSIYIPRHMKYRLPAVMETYQTILHRSHSTCTKYIIPIFLKYSLAMVLAIPNIPVELKDGPKIQASMPRLGTIFINIIIITTVIVTIWFRNMSFVLWSKKSPTFPKRGGGVEGGTCLNKSILMVGWVPFLMHHEGWIISAVIPLSFRHFDKKLFKRLRHRYQTTQPTFVQDTFVL